MSYYLIVDTFTDLDHLKIRFNNWNWYSLVLGYPHHIEFTLNPSIKHLLCYDLYLTVWYHRCLYPYNLIPRRFSFLVVSHRTLHILFDCNTTLIPELTELCLSYFHKFIS